MPKSPHNEQLYWGLFQRREYLTPTWRGWVAFVAATMFLSFAVLLGVRPFLAVTAPVSADVLVVEGWVPDYVLAEAKSEFDRGQYRMLYVTGGPLEIGTHLSKYETYAALGAATLMKMGISAAKIEAIPSPAVERDRTFTSALALKSAPRFLGSDSINLMSFDAHSRRSQALYQKALGKQTAVGIIAVPSRGYDANRWWTSSEGVRTIIGELIAYAHFAIAHS